MSKNNIQQTEWNKVDYYYGIGTLIDDNHLDYRENGYGAHLHLQMFLTEQPYKSFIEIMKFDTLKDKKEPKTGFVCSDRNIVNPFDYSETYEKDSKK